MYISFDSEQNDAGARTSWIRCDIVRGERWFRLKFVISRQQEAKLNPGTQTTTGKGGHKGRGRESEVRHKQISGEHRQKINRRRGQNPLQGETGGTGG